MVVLGDARNFESLVLEGGPWLISGKPINRHRIIFPLSFYLLFSGHETSIFALPYTFTVMSYGANERKTKNLQNSSPK